MVYQIRMNNAQCETIKEALESLIEACPEYVDGDCDCPKVLLDMFKMLENETDPNMTRGFTL